jgi:hypothetical protein
MPRAKWQFGTHVVVGKADANWLRSFLAVNTAGVKNNPQPGL